MSSPKHPEASPWVPTKESLPPVCPDPLNWKQSSDRVLIRLRYRHRRVYLARYVIPLWDDEPDPDNPPYWERDGADGYRVEPIDVEAWCPIPP